MKIQILEVRPKKRFDFFAMQVCCIESFVMLVEVYFLSVWSDTMFLMLQLAWIRTTRHINTMSAIRVLRRHIKGVYVKGSMCACQQSSVVDAVLSELREVRARWRNFIQIFQ